MDHPLHIDCGFIQREMAYWKVPGLAVSFIQRGRKPVCAGFGWRNLEEIQKTDENTQFGIASCTKAMTAAVIAMLCAEGLLDWEKPVVQYVPELQMKDPRACREMTLQDMLCHKTGLPGHDALWPGKATRRELAERIRWLQPSQAFRTKAQYSNLMYAMAGYVAERATGQSWETLMEQKLFQPLGMNRTGCRTEELKGSWNHAEPYQMTDGQLRRLPIWNVDLAGPAASVYSTAADMAKWLSFLTAAGADPQGTPLLPEEYFQQLFQPWAEGLDNSGIGEECFPCSEYGFGWCLGSYRDTVFRKHTGKIEGYSSIQSFLPEEGIGVAIMANLHSPATSILHTILYTLLDQALGVQSSSWAEKFHSGREPREEDYKDCEMDLFEGAEFPEQRGNPYRPLEAYQGDYRDPGYGALHISCTAEGLRMKYRDMDLPLKHWRGEVFSAEGVKEDIWTMRVPVTFQHIENPELAGVLVRFEPLVQDIFFKKES